MTNVVLERVDSQLAEEEPRGAARKAPPAPPEAAYLAAIQMLYDRAEEQKEVRLLVWAMTRGLARVLFEYRKPLVTADVLGWLSAHLKEFAERERAEQELRELQEQGGRPS